MRRLPDTLFAAAALLLLLAATGASPAMAQGGWQQAMGPRTWSFPGDHGRHDRYRTEWWYFTGNLADPGGARYGYELTFFRQGLRPAPLDPANPWSLRDVYLAHFALTDVRAGTFWFAEQLSRPGPGLAGAAESGLYVWCLNWSAGDTRGGKAITLSARRDGRELNLALTPRKPPVLHGQRGLSKKGDAPGQASYYYSLTDLKTSGTIRTAGNKPAVAVSGRSWFDHEFGSNELAADQAGWDWFGLHLSDGRELMLYFLRKKDGSREAVSSGTLVEPDGRSRHLSLAEIKVEALAFWKSPRSGGRYPSRWRIAVPSAGIDVEIACLTADQELDTAASTGIVYYEGAVAGKGVSAGRQIEAEGYAEMTGYAGSLGGRL